MPKNTDGEIMANNQELVDEIFHKFNQIQDLIKECHTLLEEIEVEVVYVV